MVSAASKAAGLVYVISHSFSSTKSGQARSVTICVSHKDKNYSRGVLIVVARLQKIDPVVVDDVDEAVLASDPA